jgi:catechol 2,3-dioxygenase-like lactoylglutathione lyase family enzyme
MPDDDEQTAPEFLCVTMYAEDIAPLRAYYHDALGLPIDYEEPGHISAMPKVCAHDPSEGPAGSMRLFFLTDDVVRFAAAVGRRGANGSTAVDGLGNPAWHSTDPFGNSVHVLTRTNDGRG